MITANVYIDFLKKKTEDGITVGSQLEAVPVDAIKNHGSDAHPRYMAKVHDPEKNASYSFAFNKGREVWVILRKRDNKCIKLPALKDREVVDV